MLPDSIFWKTCHYFYISQTPILSVFPTDVSVICLSRAAVKSQCFKQARYTKREVPIESLMGPMLNMVTWYKKHLAGWQIMQWSKKNKEITSFKKLISFLFKVPLLCLPSSKVVFVPHDCILQRVHCAYIFGKK